MPVRSCKEETLTCWSAEAQINSRYWILFLFDFTQINVPNDSKIGSADKCPRKETSLSKLLNNVTQYLGGGGGAAAPLAPQFLLH